MTPRRIHFPVWFSDVGRRKRWIFAGLFFLHAVPQTILLTVVPLQAHLLLGNARNVSILYFGIGLAGLPGRLGIPWLTRAVPRRNVFSLGAVCLIAGASLLSADAAVPFIAGMAVNAFGIACLEVILNLYVLDHISRHELGRFEPMRLFLEAGPWMIGPWLGVHLKATATPWLPFAIAGTAGAVLLVYFWILRLGEYTGPRSIARVSPNPLRYLPRFFAQPRLLLAWTLAAGRSGWWSMFYVYAPIFAVTSGLGEQVGGIIASIGSSWLWIVPLWGWIARRTGLRRMLCVSYAVAGLLSLAVAAALGVPWLGAGVLVLATLAAASLDGAGNLLFLRAVHPFERAEMTTVYVSYHDAAQLIPPGVFSVLLLVFELPAVFVAGGAMMLGMSSLTRHIPRRF